MTTLYEYAGGEPAIRRFVEIFYASVLADPLTGPLFGGGRPTHVDHLTAVLGEVYGGPDRYTQELGGFPALLAAHRQLRISEEQRQRFADLYRAAADRADLPADEKFRTAFTAYVDFGSAVARHNSFPENELHPCQEIPRWNWDG